MSTTSDVIVIGGGHNGLVAACYLARGGLSVEVLEAAATVGGMSATAPHIPDAPNHLINSCAIDLIFIRGTRIVQELELARFGYREVEMDPFIVYLHPDGASIAFWRDPARTAAEIRTFSPADAESYLDLVRRLDLMLSMGLPLMMTNPRRPDPRALARAAATAVRHGRQLAGLGSLAVGSAAQVIDERFQHPVVRDAFATLAFGSIQQDGSALNLMFPNYHHRFGAARPVGGTQALPNALAAALKATGGTVRTGAVVEQILIVGGRAVGVRLQNGEELHARRGVVATCDVRTALGTLLPSGTLDPVHEARVAHIPSSSDGCGYLKVDIAVSGRLRLDRHEKWRGDGLDLREPSTIAGGFEQTLASHHAARAGRIPPAPNLWMAVPTGLDPSQAPTGQDTLYLWAHPVPLEPDVAWNSAAVDAAARIVTQAAEFYDGGLDLEIGRWVETPDDFARRMRVTNGCLYHTDFSLFRLGPLRPAAGLAGYRTPVPGLYLGGAGSHPSPGVSGLPGRLAAREVLRKRPR